MAKAIDPPAKALGYTDCGEYIAGVSFGKHDEEIHKSFSFLVRWELARRLQPNGPIEIKYLTDDFLKRWKGFSTEQEVCDEIHKWAQRQQESTKRGTGRPKLPLPKALDSSFWTGLAAVGGEAAAMEAGNLSFQVAIERHTCDGPHFRMKMAPPVLENSGRLLRLYPTQRIIRAKIDQELLYRLQDPLIYVDDDAADDKTLGKRDSARNLVARFQKLFYKPIHLLDGAYRLFYGKAGTRTLLLWSERSLRGRYQTLTVPDLLDTLIPMNKGKNAELSIAKYTARIALFDSQTIAISAPENIAWVPDLTNHTLPILPRELSNLARKLGMPFVPCKSRRIQLSYVSKLSKVNITYTACISGKINGETFVWSSYHGGNLLRLSPTKEKIAIFEETLKRIRITKAASNLVEIEFTIHFGKQREQRSCTVLYRRAELLTRKRPEYAEEVMTDGNGLLSWSFAQRVHTTLGLKGEAIATAYQARIGGCKGLWNLPCDFDPEGSDGEWIEIRDSQHKCDVLSQAFTFDVVRRSMPSGGGSIGPQAMAVLRQVHKSRKLNQDLESAISALKKEAGEEADLTFLEEEDVPSLIAALDKTCHAPAGDNVGTLRSTLKSRYKDADDDELQLFEDDNYQTVHPLSGRPVQWESQVKMLLLAGFPLDHSFVQAKLQRIREALVKKDQESRCPVPRSRHAFVVADHTGILKPNEIFYQSSAPLRDPYTDRQMRSVLTGDVLLNRSPTAQASDWQLCQAVDVPALATLFDVVVCSSRGCIPFMAKLSGGDYDGDTVDLIWEPRLTANWVNRSDQYIQAPFETEEYFIKQPVQIGVSTVHTINEFLGATSASDNGYTRHLQEALLMPFLLPTSAGRLSLLHDQLLLSRGVHDQTKVIAGHLYTTALDAAKQGVRFKYAHLQASSLENLIRSKTVAEKELALLRAKALDSESDSDRPDPPYHLTPRLPTQDTSTGPANNDNSKRLPQQDERGAISSDQAVQAVDDEISARPPKDDDVSDLWLQACEDKVVFALAKGTPLERMKDFAFTQLENYRAYRTTIAQLKSLGGDQYVTRQRRESNAFIRKFWNDAKESLDGSDYVVASPLTWRHLLVTSAHSQIGLVKLSDTFAALVGFKFLCDLKAVATSSRMQSSASRKDILGPTMVNFAILNSKAQRRAKRDAAVPSTVRVQQVHQQKVTTADFSPKRKAVQPEEPSPSKRTKDATQLWTPTKRAGRRMETEVSPLSSRGSLVSKISVVLDEEEDDAFTEMLADDVLTEEEELLAEIDELLLYREGNLTDDSGIGSSQETVRSDGVSETSLQKRETVKSAKWTLPKIPKIPFSQYLGSK